VKYLSNIVSSPHGQLTGRARAMGGHRT